MDVKDFLEHAANNMGFVRERYVERNIPTNHNSLAILPFFGDLRAQTIASSLLLHRFRKDEHGSKYFILLGFPGYGGLYPYVDEYWSIRDEAAFGKLLETATGFNNANERIDFYKQQLHQRFQNVYDVESFSKYWKDGLTSEFFERHSAVIVDLPHIPSARVELSRQLTGRPGYKIFTHPTRMVNSWLRGSESLVPCPITFWKQFLTNLVERGCVPVVYQSPAAYDLTTVDGCLHCGSRQINEVMGTMRATGCVLDIFNDLSRLAIVARCPFISCAERHRYNVMKYYEVDDLCANMLPYKYIFSFTTMIGQWKELADIVWKKMDEFIPTLNRDTWPNASESAVVVPYTLVRKHKNRKIGSKFIKVPKI